MSIIPTLLDRGITRELLAVPQGSKIQAEYVWLGGSSDVFDIRSKGRTLDTAPSSPDDLPIWNYDGSSTEQAPGSDSEVFIKPRAIFKDPFRGGDNILVMCDTYVPPQPGDTEPLGPPLPTNARHKAAAIMADPKAVAEKPWFGIEQEYTLFDAATDWPLGWPKGGFPGPQGPYYCGAGAKKSFGRDVVEAHYRVCLAAGINISGVNGEVMPGQWEYQVGPCEGISMGDHLWMSRYLMYRVCEMFGVEVSFDPKPIPGDWNGAGCHTNYSTEKTRTAPGGWAEIQAHCEKLKPKHMEHIAAYGEGNERRLTGKHETAPIDQYSYGVANRGCSIRVPRMVPVQDCGYYEDRRPASNMDPYVVCGKIVETTLL